MKKIIAIVSLVFYILFLSAAVQARSGCCSHHQGVCGCSCCDGTPLSSTCAPYYPECNGGGGAVQTYPTNTPIPPTHIPYPTVTFTRTPTLLPTNTPTIGPTTEVLGTETTNTPPQTGGSSGFASFLTLVVLGGLGYGGYRYLKNKTTRNKSQEI